MQSADTADVPNTAAGPESGARLKQGDTVGGRFVIDERIRDGVLGTTYRAVDEKSGKRIAILLLDPAVAGDREATDAVRAAVKQATGLAHKNLVSVFGMGKDGQRRYLAREYVDGQTLAELLEKKAAAGKRFTLKGAYNLIAHVCNALDAAQGTLTHGTLRPSAVLINRTGRVKLADLGLGQLRGALVAKRDALDPWDQACVQRLEGDDLFALGAMLFGLLAGRPPAVGEGTLPADVQQATPTAVVDIVAQLLDLDAADRFADPLAVKAALQAAVREAEGAAAPAAEAGAQLHAGASLEVLDPSGLSAEPTSTHEPRPAARPKTDGGFVIPELGTPGQVDDDGTVQRWLIARDGTDYGPYTRKAVVEQLFKEEINAEATLYDIETDRRAALAEFPVFDQALVDWIHEKADREKKRAEATAAAAARRRNRVLGGIVALVLLGAGGGAGGWFWYRSTLPEPVAARLPRLVSTLSEALPAITLPEELPETEAEVRERREKAAAKQSAARSRYEAAKVAREAKLAASSELTMGAGDGSRFDRPAFDRAMGGRQAALMRCLQDEVRRDPSLTGVKVRITVIPRGELINVQLDGGTPRGQTCVRGALSGLRVPSFDGTNVKVSLPFNFQR